MNILNIINRVIAGGDLTHSRHTEMSNSQDLEFMHLVKGAVSSVHLVIISTAWPFLEMCCTQVLTWG